MATIHTNYAQHATNYCLGDDDGFHMFYISMYFVNNFEPNLTLCGYPASFRLIEINTNPRFVKMYVTLSGHKKTFDPI